MHVSGANLGRSDMGKGEFWRHKREVEGHGNSVQEGPGSAASIALLINEGRSGWLGGLHALLGGSIL